MRTETTAGRIRLGAWLIHRFETVVLGRLPIISNVYSSVKQVTDFLFSERQIAYNRVVAIEYPRRGIWSLGFVTGDSLLEMTAAAGTPLVSVLVPTSPMPVTGYTMSIPRSEVLDLNMTIDQAFQFCVSCGVLVPPQQVVTPEFLQQELAKRLIAAGHSGVVPENEERPQPHAAVEPGLHARCALSLHRLVERVQRVGVQGVGFPDMRADRFEAL